MLKHWLENNYTDFESSSPLRPVLQKYLDRIGAEGPKGEKYVAHLRHLLVLIRVFFAVEVCSGVLCKFMCVCVRACSCVPKTMQICASVPARLLRQIVCVVMFAVMKVAPCDRAFL